MPPVQITYPHRADTLAPTRMTAREIWGVAEQARRRLCPHPRRPRVSLPVLIAAARCIDVNGCKIETQWEFGAAVKDPRGLPAFGATEYDPLVPGVVRISVHGPGIGTAEDILRSTALHELGHVVFDAPGWIRNRDGHRLVNSHSEHVRISAAAAWSEWRANEFMGAFLAPELLLHGWAVKRAACLGFRLRTARTTLPLIALDSCGERDQLLLDLAEIFGVSPDFIAVRLAKYRIMAGAVVPYPALAMLEVA